MGPRDRPGREHPPRRGDEQHLINLLTAEQYASAHASYVSNSWGSAEVAGEASDDSYFTHAGVSYFAAAGDTAASVLWPSASPDVTSVGGTTLAFTSDGDLAQETVWSDGGGGCSADESAGTYQSTASAELLGRRDARSALSANPNSGVSVYDSVRTKASPAGGRSAARAPRR